MSYIDSFVINDNITIDSKSCSSDDLFEGILDDYTLVNDGTRETNATSDEQLITHLTGSSHHSEPNTMKYSVQYLKSQTTCMSKNAILARENRQKKKEYVTNLEASVEKLHVQNSNLMSKMGSMESEMSDLVAEVEYLKGVIANQSTLSKLIGSVCSTPGVRFYSSFNVSNKCPTNVSKDENDNTNFRKRKSSVFDDSPSQENRENVESSINVKRGVRRSTRNISNNSVDKSENQEKKRQGHSENQENKTISNSENLMNGICLHVAGDAVSLEFCATCSKMATNTKKAANVSASHVLREKVRKRKK
ncbi:uncharacterized protein LOC127738608 [Mytilus californianus]|uniref:uncharacterized protein LOC127738608 n=1 Tax=Mytilus californianus TaxID=6549 RepID=UPI00224761D4|nr:uncharacterized protein LOC127738608 [Mytilus californianus]XP_052105900.1 uncharacterized protein LOC127738608 [Mytilus californianus]